jgi:hypothetical protein
MMLAGPKRFPVSLDFSKIAQYSKIARNSMNHHTTLIYAWMLTPLAAITAFGQPAGARRTSAPAAIASSSPTITILPAPSGAMLRSEGPGNAALDLGKVSYFRGASAPGESSRKTPGSLVISTRFVLRVDCPGSSSSSQVNVTMSRADAAETHDLAIDGIKLGTAPQPLAQSMPCGSSAEHRLEVEVPVSTPAGPIGSNVAFEATLRK